MILGVVSTLYSQIIFMPKAGASLSSVMLSDDFKFDGDTYGSKIGLIAGVAVEIPLIGERLALQPELLFHQKGYSYKYDDGDGYTEDYKYTINYIELPILAKVKFGKFYAQAGPSISYGLGGWYKGDYTYQGQQIDDEGKIKFGTEPNNNPNYDEYIDNALDIGVQLGAGVQVSVIVIDLRYGLGLTNMYDDVAGYDAKSKNGSLQLTVGVPLGGKK